MTVNSDRNVSLFNSLGVLLTLKLRWTLGLRARNQVDGFSNGLNHHLI